MSQKRFKYNFKKSKPSAYRKKIATYLQDPKVQEYIKGLDDNQISAFKDSLLQMKNKPSYKPDIFKSPSEKTHKIVPKLYTVPKSILHPDVLKEVEHIQSDTLRLNKSNLNNLLNIMQSKTGGSKKIFDDEKDTFKYKDEDKETIKENLDIITKQMKKGKKPNQTFIDEILKINPALGDSLMQEINKVKDDPKKDTGDGISNWAKKLKKWYKDNITGKSGYDNPPSDLKEE